MKIIDIRDLRAKKAISRADGHLREFKEYYEYCLIDDYEMKYDDFNIDSIQMVDFFVSILEDKGKFIPVSLQFPKTYDVHEIVEWLDGHRVTFNQTDQKGYYIEQADAIIEMAVYKSMPIVVATRGKNKLYVDIDDLVDVTAKYAYYSKNINTELAKSVDIPEQLSKESKTKKKYAPSEMWVDDTDKDDWIDRWLDGDGHPGSESDRKKK